MKKIKIDPEKIIKGNPVNINGRCCNIPPHRNAPPPPSKKKSIWERYSNGEILIPTYDLVLPKSIIRTPERIPSPQEPRRIQYGKLDKSEIKTFLLGVFVFAFVVTCMCLKK
ncbi:hypothetical protein ACR1PO_15715 [Chryseobacterium sp. RRHN12]|uniref:hypothetical protein n=1 Tax=Chryseobacterium sp. RRHN12 TaxID=3437884 RepID=UPI003D9B94A5